MTHGRERRSNHIYRARRNKSGTLDSVPICNLTEIDERQLMKNHRFSDNREDAKLLADMATKRIVRNPIAINRPEYIQNLLHRGSSRLAAEIAFIKLQRHN